ncbi:nuclear transport factor 2 family protein [Microbulbifer sp. SA54]|uniref:nuclear transport factor 2 family protein n=1 Tax=Microbulbifer sp. SA54 TaxID=3401577 RepID=UPI003AAC05E4
MPNLLAELQAYYRNFLTADPEQLGLFYRPDVVFRDPVHEVAGLTAVRRYFEGTREGLNKCVFEFDSPVVSANGACLPWHMHFSHRALQGGKNLTLRGCSLVQFEDKIYFHEDFYDMGAMVYERVPVVGSVVRAIKSRIARAGEG